MRVEYDVPIRTGKVPYTIIFWDFYESDHQNAKIDYETAEEAKKAYQGLHNLLVYKNIADVRVVKRGNTLYLIRNAKEKECESDE